MKEINHAFFLDEMAEQYAFNDMFEKIILHVYPQYPLPIPDGGLNEIYRAVPPAFRPFADRIPMKHVRDGFSPFMPYQGKIAFQPDKLTIVEQFNPEKISKDRLSVEEFAALGLLQLFNQVGRPKGIIVATQSMDSLSGYFVRTFTHKDHDYRGTCEVEMDFHHNPMINQNNVTNWTTARFVKSVAELICDTNTNQRAAFSTWYTLRK